MSVAIRMKREGTKDRPYYRVVVTDSRSRRDGPYIESIGVYDPMKKGVDNFELDLEKMSAWVGKGAKASETVRSLARRARKTGAAS